MILDVTTAVVYIAYISTVCLVCIHCSHWWSKILVTGVGMWGLTLMPDICIKLAELFSSLFSLAVSGFIYFLLIAAFICCMFPKLGKRLFR